MKFMANNISMLHADRRQILLALPKVDLHRHLEGCLRLETQQELGRRQGLELPLDDPERLLPHVAFQEGEPRTLNNFLAKFRADWYRTFADIQRVVREALEDASRENVAYLELRFSPEHFHRHTGLKIPDIIKAICEAGLQVAEDEELLVRFLLTFARERYDRALWNEALDAALANYHLGVRGVDLAGDEFSHPNERFAEFFRRVRDTRQLHVTIHAGEGTSAASVKSAVEILGAERIGHGVSAAEDAAVMEMLARQKVALELCPISNYQTGCVDDLSHHPLPELEKRAVPVTINSDDPSIHMADLTDNHDVALSRWGYGLEDLLRLQLQAVEFSFLEAELKPSLAEHIRQGYSDALTEEG